jgi:CheY-like chemotaxis protein/anti-sigma regulatory factor (Ser/Thr protein kinase)
VIESAIDAVRPMAEARGIELEVTADPRAGRVRVDPDRIQQVIWNLINNAVKFTEKGGRVTLRLKRQDGHIQIQVTDTGRGISPQFLPHVFERFRQEDASTTRTLGGLGLGLSISKQLVELHGGAIRAESAGEGKGATFTVELPLANIEAAADPKGQPGDAQAAFAASSFTPSPVLRGVRVLVVEDEAHTRSAIQRVLEDCQAEVTAVESAALAVAAFREKLSARKYDVLLSDVSMPVQNGYELMHEIRDMERQRGERQLILAVALTAYAREEDRARAWAAGFQSHLPKPVEPERLVKVLARLVGRTRDIAAS